MAGEASGAAVTAAASSGGDSARAADVAKAVFIDDVDAYMRGRAVEDALLELQERLRRLRAYEAQVLQTKRRLMDKLPEIEKSLGAVEALIAKRGEATDDPLAVDFELADGIYAKAEVRRDVEAVGLWLGAGVMVEYPLDEARALLASNKEACEANLKQASESLGVLKDSITVTEVNTARVFNWDVEQRRQRKGA